MWFHLVKKCCKVKRQETVIELGLLTTNIKIHKETFILESMSEGAPC